MTAGVEEFEAQRPRLFALAYRMLGSAAEAEDAVQDAYLRWARTQQRDTDPATSPTPDGRAADAADPTDPAPVENPAAWLAKVVTNLCLTRLTSARARREEYVGQWLPEPVLTGDGALGPLDTAEQRESVSLALLVLLERLTPAERAVFVLREAFGHSHREVADVLDVSEANSRQLYRRAKQSVAVPGPPVRSPTGDEVQHLVRDFLAAAQDGDVPRLERVLAADVVSYADGGGHVGAARRPVAGRDKVARYVAGLLTRFAADVELLPVEANGGPALLGLVDGQLAGVVALDVSGGRIDALRIIANPEKLTVAERQLAQLSHSAGLHGPSW